LQLLLRFPDVRPGAAPRPAAARAAADGDGGTLLDRNYLGLSHAAAYDRIVRLAAICRKFAGTFNLLWHNNRLVEAAERRFYASVLEAIVP
jgi:hypothetical protein